MKVRKRDGALQEFGSNKIRQAIVKANNDTQPDCRIWEGDIDAIVSEIVYELTEGLSDNDIIDIEHIQDTVELVLQRNGYYYLAKNYIKYRYSRELIRKSKQYLIDEVAEKLEAVNVQNQNANVDEKSFGGRMGEANRVVTKDYALNNCMSEMAKNNHLNNEIYIHDLDSYAVGMHNCYDSDTAFVTNNGVKKFKELCDGQKVVVVDKYGNWKDAIVKRYGKQKMYELTFKSSLTTKTVCCTRNHRWVLEDGSVTDNIQIGDSLYMLNELKNSYTKNNELWCFGFVIGDGSDFNMYSKDRTHVTNSGMTVRLCNDKTKYKNIFMQCGWSVRQEHSNGDITMLSRGNGAYKQLFLDNKIWKIMSHDDLCNIFNGYLSADGHVCKNGSVMLSTSDDRVKEFIEYTSSVCGYYVWSKNKKHNNTNYKENRDIYEFYLVKKQSTKWTLVDIKASRDGDNGYKVAWCVEEPTTNTFTLDGGMVTGNCLSVPFDKLLANGFNTRQTDVRPANSINTAFQLVAVIFQIQSLQQFGGVSATHLDWTMVPYVRKSFTKHLRDGMKYFEDKSDYKLKRFNAWLEKDMHKDGTVHFDDVDFQKLHPQSWEYAMDMTLKEINQAVEGMYHNLNTLQSRSGNQLPFTSINYGTCTLPEGRMVTKALLEASIDGLGKLHKTSIFPCGIFQCMKGVNREKGDPNYDLYQLALRSTSQRLYPNYANVDWSGNAGYDINDPRTYFSTMG
ncbi:MAG: anaerobic ribonucleoside-triphosphate reductase [Erysipelotrichaceae bacterium]|nr:anaerobic ribonucleoside-triphosphate reductase [Erysipelotrichaceae bacterium]